MIKRRFYNLEHGDAGDDSDSSSSSSSSSDPAASSQFDSGLQRPADGEREEVTSSDKGDAASDSPSPGSGYESEDSSGNEVYCDSSGLLVNDDENTEEGKRRHEDNLAAFISGNKKKEDRLSNNTKSISEKDAVQPELEKYILRCKSVFKCRLCPRIVCLSEETLKTHLNSKRHARSKKLLNEGRLKLMLNSDGEVEEEQETHAERHARTMTLVQGLENPKKRNKGRQRQRNRLKKVNNPEERKTKQVANTQTKKKRKVKD